MEFLILMVQWEEEITIKVQDTDLANISLSTSLNYLVSNLSRTAGREKLLKTMSRVCNFSTFLKMSAMTYDLLFQSMKSEALLNRRRIYGGCTPLYVHFLFLTLFFKIRRSFFASVIKIISGIYC